MVTFPSAKYSGVVGRGVVAYCKQNSGEATTATTITIAIIGKCKPINRTNLFSVERNNLNKQQHLLAQKKEGRRKITWVNKSVHVSLIEEPIVFFNFYIFANVLYCTAQCKTSPRYCILWHRFFWRDTFLECYPHSSTCRNVATLLQTLFHFVRILFIGLNFLFLSLNAPTMHLSNSFSSTRTTINCFSSIIIFINSCFRFYLILLSFIFLSQEKNNKIKK